MDEFEEEFGMIFEEHWKLLMKRVSRRERLCKNVGVCICCGSNNIQLLDSNLPAQWKCRDCKTKFIYEPLIVEKL